MIPLAPQRVSLFHTDKNVNRVGADGLQIPRLTPFHSTTDNQYEEFLPTVARPRASGVINKNLNMTEIRTKPDLSTDKKETKDMLRRHRAHESAEMTYYTGEYVLLCPFQTPFIHGLWRQIVNLK